MKPITAPKPRAPKGRNDHEQTKDMNASKRCVICKSQVAYDAHICSQCGSHDFEYGDIQVTPTAPNPVVPQPNQQGPKNMLVHAVKLKNREKDDPKDIPKLEPFSTFMGMGSDEKGFEEPVEKEFSDPTDHENSDIKHMKAVEQTWKDLMGDE